MERMGEVLEREGRGYTVYLYRQENWIESSIGEIYGGKKEGQTDRLRLGYFLVTMLLYISKSPNIRL